MKSSKYILCFTLLLTTFAKANEDLSIEQIMAISKISGSCGQLQSQIIFQEQTELKEGEKFVVRYWTTEAARLGHTLESYTAMCIEMLEKYATLKNIFEE